MKCPACQSPSFRLSHRGPFERILSIFLPVRPYRCNSCDRRVWGLARPVFTLTRLLVGTALLLGFLILGFDYWLAFQSAYTNVDVEPTESGSQEYRARETLGPETEKEPMTTAFAEPITGTGDVPLEIQRMKVDTTPGRIEIRLDGNAIPRDYNFFSIDEKRQLILDLPGNWTEAESISRNLQIDSPLAFGVRTGIHTGYFRLVVDLQPGVQPVTEVTRGPTALLVTILADEPLP